MVNNVKFYIFYHSNYCILIFIIVYLIEVKTKKKQKAMETKKSLKANLEKGKIISFMMGLIVALAVLFTAFEWGERDIKIETNTKISEPLYVGEPPLPSVPEPPEPPKPEVIKNQEILVIVDDSEKVDPYKITPSEFNEKEPQPVYVYTPPVIEDKEEINPDEIIIHAEIMPVFPGGDAALLKWIAERIVYPTVAAENGIDGLVSCSFVVNADGSISNVEIVRSKDPLLDKEAVRVLKLLPNWKPGMQGGKFVRVKYNVPVRFRLQK